MLCTRTMLECICALYEVRGAFVEEMEGHSCMYFVSMQHLAKGTVRLRARISTYVYFVNTVRKSVSETRKDGFFVTSERLKETLFHNGDGLGCMTVFAEFERIHCCLDITRAHKFRTSSHLLFHS